MAVDTPFQISGEYKQDCPFCKRTVTKAHYTKNGWCPERRIELDKNGC